MTWDEQDSQRMRDRLGEDPAQFLDKPLETRSGWRHTTAGYHSTSDPIDAIRSRIRGIDRLQVVAAYLTVEHRLDRGPRDQVVSLLEQRREHLEATGGRDLPEWSSDERRERAEQQYEAVKEEKLGRRDHSDVHFSSSVPWPTGKDALEDSDEQDEQDTEELENPEDHPLVAGFMQASADSDSELATDGGRET